MQPLQCNTAGLSPHSQARCPQRVTAALHLWQQARAWEWLFSSLNPGGVVTASGLHLIEQQILEHLAVLH